MEDGGKEEGGMEEVTLEVSRLTSDISLLLHAFEY